MLRITLIITALISAFFSSIALSNVPFQKAQVDADSRSIDIGDCNVFNDTYSKGGVGADECLDIAKAKATGMNGGSIYGDARLGKQTSATRWDVEVFFVKKADCKENCGSGFWQTHGIYTITGTTKTNECPPRGAPDFTEMFEYVDPITKFKLQKCKMPDVGEHCPMPSDSDIFAIPVASGARCYNNPDGTVCKYKEKAGQISYQSAFYRSEGVQCGVDDGTDTNEPIIPPSEPILPPDTPTPEKTLPPDGTDADPSSSGNETEALNKVNENLKAITDNQIDFGRANIEAINSVFDAVVAGNAFATAAYEQNERAYKAQVAIGEAVINQSKQNQNLIAVESDSNRQLRAIKDELRNGDPQLVDLNEKTKGLGVDVSTIKETAAGVKTDTNEMSQTLLGIKGDTGQLVTIAGEGNELIKTMIGKMPCNPAVETCPEPPTPPEPECDSEKELCKGSIKAPTEKEFDKTLSASFWESQYENGLQGVWDEKAEELKNTGAIKFIEQFKVQASGSLPDTQICFNLGSYMDFGCKALPMPDGRTLAFIKLVILISAAFACRRIIFGG